MSNKNREILPSHEPQQKDWLGRTVYQIYPNTFHEARPSGMEHTGRGSIQGVIEKLDYLDKLGIGIVWLSPFYKSPLKDGGYDISDHMAIDPGLGTLEDIEELIEKAHERDIKLLFDLVPNHTSDQHEWFLRSCKEPESNFGDYYIWADPRILRVEEPPLPRNIVSDDRLEDLPHGLGVPNNWSSVFSLPELEKVKDRYGDPIPEDVEVPARTAWVWHPGRQQFYLAEFSKEQPSLNWDNPEVREAVANIMRFWLDKGIDGFRVDVINHIGKDPDLRDEEPVTDESYQKGVNNPHDQWKQERLVSYMPKLEVYANELISVLDEFPDRNARLVFEDWITALSDQPDILSRLRPDKATIFNFKRLLKTNRVDWRASVHKELLDTYYERFADPALSGSLPNQVDSNHDVDRVVTRLGLRPALAAAVIKLTTPGTPYIFQGEEGGLPSLSYDHIPPHRRKDDDLGLRDGERSPIPWNSDTNGGFSKAPEERLWLPMTPDYHALNLKDQERDPRSPYSLYRAAIALRNTSHELLYGAYTPLNTDRSDAFAFARPHPDERRQSITLVNFSGETIHAAILNAEQGLARIALSSYNGLLHDHRQDIRLDHGHLWLQPHEAVLLQPPA